MNHEQHRKRRPLTAMPGHALALSGMQHAADKADAHRMGVLTRMRQGGSVKASVRMLFLAGLLK